MPDQVLMDKANEYLLREFGRGDGEKVNYRVVWSTRLTEKRYGTFNDFYGKIFVRTVTEVREVLKYPHDQDRYIVERLENARRNPELIEDLSYEPIFVLKDKYGFYLPLNMKVIEFLAKNIKTPPSSTERRAQLEQEMADEEEKEVQEFLEIIQDNGRSPLFAYEDSVFLDSTKRKVE